MPSSEPLAGAGGGSRAAGGVIRAPDALQKLLVMKSCGVWGCLAAQLAGKGFVLSGGAKESSNSGSCITGMFVSNQNSIQLIK